MARKKSKSEILVELKDKEYLFDDAALQYASLTEEEAKARVQEVKAHIAEIEGDANLSSNPQRIHELRELRSTLAWFKLNKYRSKYFRIDTGGPSMRKAKRHPETNWLGNKNGNSSNRRKSKNGHKRKKVQISKSIFSRIFGNKQEDKLADSKAV